VDLTQTIIAKSNQLNADDLVGGPQTFTVVDVRLGDAEQPVAIVLAEWPEGRPFKPSKTVLRILVTAWGKESDDWPKNARMTLYRDASVKWAGSEVGGIRVSHLSHITEPLKIALQESKGKTKLYTVEPLPDAPVEPTPQEAAEQIAAAIAKADTEAEVREWGNHAHKRSLLDVEVDGQPIRSHVTRRLSEFATADDTPNAEPTQEALA
jgi:hypothetical protein